MERTGIPSGDVTYKDRRLAVSIAATSVRMDEEGKPAMKPGTPAPLIPVHADLTMQAAADMLNISRPSLIQLLDEGKSSIGA